jgi:hypothetical protein
MYYFANIVSSVEQFSVSKFVHHVEEFYGINTNCFDLFDDFRRQAPSCFTPSLLSELASKVVLFPHCPLSLQHHILLGNDQLQLMPENEVPGRPRQPKEFPYQFGNVMQLNWYRKFLHPNVHEKTYRWSSINRWSDFGSYFRLTLAKVDDLTHMFIDRGWCVPSRCDVDDDAFFIKTQLQILGALNVLGNHTPFCQLTTNTELSAEDHRLFFISFCVNSALSRTSS